KLAKRYCNRWIVGGYDLLNEPIAPQTAEGKNYDYLLPKLEQFYDESIAAIRNVDSMHMISIEGHHWATNTDLFHKRYDENMVIHFHRYACLPQASVFNNFLEVSDRLDAPLWMGETGENMNEWYTALYPLSVSLGIGYNLWPWKKMNRANSPYSITIPEEWDKIIAYSKGEMHPGYLKSKEILEKYLENMKLENCRYHPEVTQSVFRLPGCRVRGTDFDEFPGKGISYSGLRPIGNSFQYRDHTGMGIVEKSEPVKHRFAFDCLWDRFVLELEKDEFAVYSIYDIGEKNTVSFEFFCEEETWITILQEELVLCKVMLSAAEGIQRTDEITLLPSEDVKIKIIINSGKLQLDCVCFR
ncbi:MAG: cellulase family glycosylhydrolase, partial [Mobilitalea sp.]